MLGTSTNWLAAVSRLLRRDHRQTSWAWIDRQSSYLLFDSYYANTAYERLFDGGQRDAINASLGNAAAADIAGLYNPVANVVDLYLNVFGGNFGDEIQVEPTGNATPALVNVIGQIWRWSNLSVEKQPLCRYAATHGNVGLRIVARNDPDLTKRRVYLKPEHPRIIRDLERDERGNITAIQLEYDVTSGLAEKATTITVREELTTEMIRSWRVSGGTSLVPYDLFAKADNGPRWEYPNALGIVPYVLLRHEYTGDTWGRNAFYKALSPLNRLNALITHVDVQVHRHVNGVLFIAASGAAPTTIDLSGLKVAYVDTRNSATTPFMQWMVAPLDLLGAIAEINLQLDMIEDSLPELKATAGKFLSGQSGQTIAELRKPAEEKVNLARANYESALIDAQKIAVSWMVLLGMADVGTGMGTRAAADAAFAGGYEDHRFNTRPLLSLTSPPPAPLSIPGAAPVVATPPAVPPAQGGTPQPVSMDMTTKAGGAS